MTLAEESASWPSSALPDAEVVDDGGSMVPPPDGESVPPPPSELN